MTTTLNEELLWTTFWDFNEEKKCARKFWHFHKVFAKQHQHKTKQNPPQNWEMINFERNILWNFFPHQLSKLCTRSVWAAMFELCGLISSFLSCQLKETFIIAEENTLSHGELLLVITLRFECRSPSYIYCERIEPESQSFSAWEIARSSSRSFFIWAPFSTDEIGPSIIITTTIMGSNVLRSPRHEMAQ